MLTNFLNTFSKFFLTDWLIDFLHLVKWVSKIFSLPIIAPIPCLIFFFPFFYFGFKFLHLSLEYIDSCWTLCMIHTILWRHRLWIDYATTLQYTNTRRFVCCVCLCLLGGFSRRAAFATSPVAFVVHVDFLLAFHLRTQGGASTSLVEPILPARQRRWAVLHCIGIIFMDISWNFIKPIQKLWYFR